MPPSVMLSVGCWTIISGLVLWGLVGMIREGMGGSWLWWIATGIALANLLAPAFRPTQVTWWWSRYSSMLGTLLLVPFLFAVILIVYNLLGGQLGAGAKFPIAMLLIVGTYALIPTALLWISYFALNRSAARRYFRVCPECSKRFTAPISFLFAKMECEQCREEA